MIVTIPIITTFDASGGGASASTPAAGGSGMSVYGGAGGRPSSSCGGGRMSSRRDRRAAGARHRARGGEIGRVERSPRSLSSKQFPAPLPAASARSAVPLPETSLFVIRLLARDPGRLPVDRGEDDDAVARAARHLVLLDEVVDAADEPDADPVVAAERRLPRVGHAAAAGDDVAPEDRVALRRRREADVEGVRQDADAVVLEQGVLDDEVPARVRPGEARPPTASR